MILQSFLFWKQTACTADTQQRYSHGFVRVCFLEEAKSVDVVVAVGLNKSLVLISSK